MFVKKFVSCLVGLSLFSLLSYKTLAENNNNSDLARKELSEEIKDIYKKIDFCSAGRLNPEIFEEAYRGYLNLRNAGKLNPEKEILTVCDFTLSSNCYRLWVIDLARNKILFHHYVAHGQGSGEEFARSFSNRENSHQSSIGFYVTADTYIGEHGLSLKLQGMDKGYNSAALKRAVVVHGAGYVNKGFISGNERLGRSWGCPALSADMAPAIINAIKDSTCLYIYYPDKKYLASSYWLNKKTEFLSSNFNNKKFHMTEPFSQPGKEDTSQLVAQNK